MRKPVGGAAAAPPANDDDDGLPNPAELVSFEVLSFYIAALGKQFEQTKKREVAELRDELQFKVQMIQTQVQAGILTQDAYVAQLQQRIAADKAAALDAKKAGERAKALEYMRRAKIMEKELSS